MISSTGDLEKAAAGRDDLLLVRDSPHKSSSSSRLLVAPLGVLGAVLATFLRGLSNDVFFQVGLLTTIGLSAKNAIRSLAWRGAALVWRKISRDSLRCEEGQIRC
jgi:AcrB/AcrD/AcrF family protein